MTAADRAAMSRIYAETGSYAEVARRLGWAYETVWKHLHDGQSYVEAAADHVPDVNLPPPKRWEELSEQEKGWLTNFAAFREEFFNRQTPPFQQEIANIITSKEYSKLLVLTPPGHGKSQCFSVDFPIWEMLRARVANAPSGWACLLVSKSEKMSKAFLSQIKQELEQNNKLAAHFGRFKPEYPDVWKQDMLRVEGFPIRKEPTFIVAGAGGQIYGWRVHLIIGDDIVDIENSATPQNAEKLAQWQADILVSRLEPDGVIAMVGTRFSGFDLYGRLKKQLDEYEDSLWHPVIYKAHDETRCEGTHCEVCKERCIHDKPYPEGCVLWPGRFGYRKLRALRSGQTTGARFEFIYNQADVPDEDALVRPEWIEKCKDMERVVWDIPPGCRVMCTLDPSPVNWAVAECWAYHPAEDRRYLVAVWRKRRVQAPEYIRLIEEWTNSLRKLGFDPMWIVEINAAQRWLLQSTEYQLMRARIGLNLQPHTTGRNKADPQYGIQCIGPAYEFARVSLPWADPESRRAVQPLIDELTAYPSGETDDTVMANWFFEFHIRKLQMPSIGQWMENAEMPPFLLERREIVDLRSMSHTKVPQPAMI